MTKEEYVQNFIDFRVKTMNKIHNDDNELCESYGIETNFNNKTDLNTLRSKYKVEANLISEKVDWNLLNTDRKRFDRIFLEEMLKLI